MSTSGGAASTPSAKLASPLDLPDHAIDAVVMEPVASLSGHTDRVWCVAWCPTAQVLASCSADSSVRLWSAPDGQTWACIGTLQGEHSRTVRHISWSPSGEYIACASFDCTASVWRRSSLDGFDYDVEGILDGHESEVKSVAWASDSTLATCSRDRTVWIWERIDEGEYECAGVLTGHRQDVKCCLWYFPIDECERPLVLSGSYDDTIKVWTDSHRQDDWQCVQSLTSHEGTVWAVALQRLSYSIESAESPPGEASPLPQPLLCSCSEDCSVIFWQRSADGRFQCVARSSGWCERAVYAVDWAPGGAPVVACASGDNSVTLLGVHKDAEGVHVSTLLHQDAAHKSDVNSVSFAPFGSVMPPVHGGDSCGVLLATGGDDDMVRLWRVKAA